MISEKIRKKNQQIQSSYKGEIPNTSFNPLQGFHPIATRHNCNITKLGAIACCIAPKPNGGGNMWLYCGTIFVL